MLKLCSNARIVTVVMAKPSSVDNKIRLNALPTVVRNLVRVAEILISRNGHLIRIITLSGF
jgi:hypothetical protein